MIVIYIGSDHNRNSDSDYLYTLMKLNRWADPGGTAIPGQPVTEVEQALNTPSFSKNEFNILVPLCRMYEILS